MSGCGVSKLADNIYVYGDLLGGITVLDMSKNICKRIYEFKDEMIRCICSEPDSSSIYCGTIKGNIYKYSYTNNNYKLIKQRENQNEENTITCIRFYKPLLIASDSTGKIYIYKNDSLIYSFEAHPPIPENDNDNFGSLYIKSEIWSFICYPPSKLNSENNLYMCTSSEDQTIRVWNINYSDDKYAEKLIKVIKDNKLAVTCLDWNIMKLAEQNKEVLISCSDDKTVNIYDTMDNFNNIYKIDFSKNINGFFTLTYISLNSKPTEDFAVTTQSGYLIIYSPNSSKIKFLEQISYGGIEGLIFDDKILSTNANDNIVNILKINN